MLLRPDTVAETLFNIYPPSEAGRNLHLFQGTKLHFVEIHRNFMSVIALLGTVPSPPSIALETACRRPIRNEQYTEIQGFDRLNFKLHEGIGWKVRSEPSAVYNCHGLTFAGRRTTIFEPEEIAKILHDDGYVQIAMADTMPGDIIVYYSTQGDAEHSGIIVQAPDPAFKIPTIISKWGKWREVLHPANAGPYQFSNARFFRLDAIVQCSKLTAK